MGTVVEGKSYPSKAIFKSTPQQTAFSVNLYGAGFISTWVYISILIEPM